MSINTTNTVLAVANFLANYLELKGIYLKCSKIESRRCVKVQC